ncbi:flagellar biosynthesis regulator FlaF [Shimia sp.]|uniref:flagellar biosynthesis regulator FlaF n=1 Tax=Shimia sp. TaxID=1954381 RepID=UPI003564E514
MTIAAYKRTISETESPRQIERRILAQVTAELERDYLKFDQAESKIEKLELLADGLRHSLWKNQQVWMAFKADLAEQGNAFDPQLKAALLSLALWVERHTQHVMAGSLGIKPLIDINRSIFQGLEGRAFQTVE